LLQFSIYFLNYVINWRQNFFCIGLSQSQSQNGEIMRKGFLVILFLIINFFQVYSQSQYITIGSTTTQVLQTLGKPRDVRKFGTSETWHYNRSEIEFKDGLVYSWSDFDRILYVTVGNKVNNASPATIGSNKSDVARANGTPWRIEKNSFSETWHYNRSEIEFKNDLVYSWNDFDNILNISLGDQIPNSPEIILYSTKRDVINYYGTPNRITNFSSNETWNYGALTIDFSNGVVVGIKDYSNNYQVISNSTFIGPGSAENGDLRGVDNDGDGRIETVFVKGYYKKNGTYVRSHYRAAPRK
jgi:hypothetical protein